MKSLSSHFCRDQ